MDQIQSSAVDRDIQGGWRISMALSMRERNDKKAWAAYEKEAKKLIKKTVKKRERISARHANDPPARGLGLSEEDKEARQLTDWYREELKKLQIKHGIK